MCFACSSLSVSLLLCVPPVSLCMLLLQLCCARLCCARLCQAQLCRARLCQAQLCQAQLCHARLPGACMHACMRQSLPQGQQHHPKGTGTHEHTNKHPPRHTHVPPTWCLKRSFEQPPVCRLTAQLSPYCTVFRKWNRSDSRLFPGNCLRSTCGPKCPGSDRVPVRKITNLVIFDTRHCTERASAGSGGLVRGAHGNGEAPEPPSAIIRTDFFFGGGHTLRSTQSEPLPLQTCPMAFFEARAPRRKPGS